MSALSQYIQLQKCRGSEVDVELSGVWDRTEQGENSKIGEENELLKHGTCWLNEL